MKILGKLSGKIVKLEEAETGEQLKVIIQIGKDTVSAYIDPPFNPRIVGAKYVRFNFFENYSFLEIIENID